MARKFSKSSPARKERQSYRKSGAGNSPAPGSEIQGSTPKPLLMERRSGNFSNSGAIGAKPLESAAYILEMSLVLRNVANDSGLNFLAYLLDMAAEEADGLLQAEKHRRSPVPAMKSSQAQ